jgi:RAD50-interacting protein 1
MVAPFKRADSAQIQPEDEARIEDYVNDKLQTHADLEGLDVLLENVRIQQDLLRRQV